VERIFFSTLCVAQETYDVWKMITSLYIWKMIPRSLLPPEQVTCFVPVAMSFVVLLFSASKRNMACQEKQIRYCK